jgi:hypothetical protein
MLFVKDIIQKKSKDQYIIKELLKDNEAFAITESTPENQKCKILCIDFGRSISRFVGLDNLLLVLKEIYGAEYLLKAINEIKPYDQLKDIKISDKNFNELINKIF